MALKNYDALRAAIETERLRIKEIKDRGTYGAEYFLIVNPEFAKQYDDEALIRAAAELKTYSTGEAQAAARHLETELMLRNNHAESMTLTLVKRTFWVTICGLIASIAIPILVELLN